MVRIYGTFYSTFSCFVIAVAFKHVHHVSQWVRQTLRVNGLYTRLL